MGRCPTPHKGINPLDPVKIVASHDFKRVGFSERLEPVIAGSGESNLGNIATPIVIAGLTRNPPMEIMTSLLDGIKN